MPNSLNAQGLTTATQAELLAQLTAAYQLIYGSDINLESDSPDGQMMNIFIQASLDILDLVVQVYNTFDPDNAIGVVLDQRCAINNIQRQGGTFTTTNITIVTSTSVNLPGLDQSALPVYTVSDGTGNQWQLITSQAGVGPGTSVFLFQSATSGANTTMPNTITIPVTIVLGVTSVNNPTTYVNLGITAETDAVLKVRRQRSTSLPSQGYASSLQAALENINGITSAYVNENTSAVTDANGIPGHSIWVVVSGTATVALALAYNSLTTYKYGDIASSGGVNYFSVANSNTGNLVTDIDFWQVYNPIAEAIYDYRNAGAGMKGSVSYTITQVDGTLFTVYWDIVVQTNPFIKMSTGSLNGVNPPNVQGIIDELVANYMPAVNAEVNINQVTTIANEADSNTLVTFPATYGFSTSAGGTYTYTLTPSALNNQFAIIAGNIIVLPIVVSCTGASYTFGTNGVLTGVAVSIAHGGSSLLFTAIGGYPTYTWSVSGSGSRSPSTGTTTTYTSGSIGTDHLTVTDALGNTMVATITVV